MMEFIVGVAIGFSAGAFLFWGHGATGDDRLGLPRSRHLQGPFRRRR